MLDEPRCFFRKCKHFLGIHYLNSKIEEEEDEYLKCKAFPDGIPEEVAYGKNKHKRPLKDQDNDIVYERG